jgi:hypothetical protein
VQAAVEGDVTEHSAPHAPQLALSVCSSTQAPPQKANPRGHMHWPFWQVVPPEQRPQADALLPSDASPIGGWASPSFVPLDPAPLDEDVLLGPDPLAPELDEPVDGEEDAVFPEGTAPSGLFCPAAPGEAEGAFAMSTSPVHATVRVLP